MSFRRRYATTRVVASGMLLLLLGLCIGVAVAGASGWSISSAQATPTSHGDRALIPNAPQQMPRPGGSAASVASPAASNTTDGTASWTPSAEPTARPTARPTAEPFRLYHVPILMYHRIVPTSEAGNSLPDLVVSPQTFSAQLGALHDAGWRSITMATLANDMETDATIPAKTFVITFDDGWSDGFGYAFPVLRQYGYVGTFFVISSRIDQSGFLSTTQLQTLEAAGDEIGNHTQDHVSLTTVSLARAKQEVENASVQVARAIGHRPVSLAYPMGGVSTPAAWVVSQIPDIKIAVTTGRGQTETWFERYDTPRVRIHPTTDPAKLVASLGH